MKSTGMKLTGIGDLLIPEEYILSGFEILSSLGVDVTTVQWTQESYEELQNINLLVETKGSEAYEPEDYIIDTVKDADIIVTQFCPITKRVIDACTNLKAIGVLRGGYENINVSYAQAKGIQIFHTPGRNANAVADFTVGMLLCECRNIAKAHTNLKKGDWVRDYTNADFVPDLYKKTVGLVGLGEIGRKVAKRLAGFDMNILAYDPYIESADYVTLVDLPTLFTQSDFISLHARFSKETEHLVNKELLNLMKPSAILVNTARSGLIDEDALYEVLKTKKIAGAALDVFDQEPPGADYPLVTLDNVTITPHLAGGTKDAFRNSPLLLAEEMKVWLETGKSNFIIN